MSKRALSKQFEDLPLAKQKGPLFHGSRADLKPGDIITPGAGAPNYPAHYRKKAHSTESSMTFMDTSESKAWQYAHTAKLGDKKTSRPTVYEVEPVGELRHGSESMDKYNTGERAARAARVTRRIDISPPEVHHKAFARPKDQPTAVQGTLPGANWEHWHTSDHYDRGPVKTSSLSQSDRSVGWGREANNVPITPQRSHPQSEKANRHMENMSRQWDHMRQESAGQGTMLTKKNKPRASLTAH